MSDNEQKDITLMNNVVAEHIKKQVREEIDKTIGGNLAVTNTPELIASIKSIQDPAQQASLIEMLKKHQSVKDVLLTNVVNSEIERKKKILDAEIANAEKVLVVEMSKDQVRTDLFSKRWFILSLMFMPIIAAIGVVAFVRDSSFFAGFIIFICYGTLISLYFSQANALNKLLQNFSPKKNRGLD